MDFVYSLTFPYKETDAPSYGFFGKQGQQRQHLDDVEYRESIFVGYRYYDTFDVPVRYCFGYGLSYTRFAYSDLQIQKGQGQTYQVTFSLKNTGDMAGSEISEVYVNNPDDNTFRTKRELRGFAKTFLKPGEQKTVEILLDERAFSVYQKGGFQVIGGNYEIQVGASLQDIRLAEKLEIQGVEMESPLKGNTKVPLSEEDFDTIYSYPRTDFSHRKPGEFTTKNSLAQMQPYSRRAKGWIFMGRLLARLMYFPKSMEEPEVRMMLEGMLEGNIDSVCNQSGGIVKKKTIQKIVDSANRGISYE